MGSIVIDIRVREIDIVRGILFLLQLVMVGVGVKDQMGSFVV